MKTLKQEEVKTLKQEEVKTKRNKTMKKIKTRNKESRNMSDFNKLKIPYFKKNFKG